MLLEDSRLDAELTLRELKEMERKFETCIVTEKEEFEKKVIEWNPDLIISDFNLQTFSGDEALAFAKKERPETPFITLSGSITKNMEVTLLEERANDVLTKDNLKRLPYAINRVLNEKEEQKKLKNTLEELKKTNEQLSGLLKEKEVLVGEVHHRVKNNLALISSFLQLEQLGVTTSDSKDQIISANILRVKSIGIVHETVYQLGSFSNIDVLKVLSEIIRVNYRERGKVQPKLKIQKEEIPATFNINVAVPFSLLLSEMMFQVLNLDEYNSFKPEQEMWISASKNNNKFIVSIVEPKLAGLLSRLQKEDGFSEIIEVLAKQIDSRLELDLENGKTNIVFVDKNVKGSSSTLV